LGAEAEVAIAHNNWGIACLEEGSMESALTHLVLAERMFVARGNRRGQAKALHNQGETYLRQERSSEAGILYERAIALAVDAGDELSAARSRTSLAILLNQQGQHEAALELHRETEILYRRLGDRPMLARVINNEGAFLLALGRWEEAVRAYEQAAQMHLEIGHLGEAAISLLNWAEILLDRGDAKQAEDRLKPAGGLLAALPDPPLPVRQYYAALLEQATAALARGQVTPS
jgi:tetratricopeptide (TPR) repeat protein